MSTPETFWGQGRDISGSFSDYSVNKKAMAGACAGFENGKGREMNGYNTSELAQYGVSQNKDNYKIADTFGSKGQNSTQRKATPQPLWARRSPDWYTKIQLLTGETA